MKQLFRFLLLTFSLGASLTTFAQTAPPPLPYLYLGGYGTFQFTLYANGVVYTPSGTYTENVTWTVNDTNATLSWNTATTLATVVIPKTDTNTSLTLTGTCTAPDGTVQTTTITVPILAPPTVYSSSINQQSEVGP